VEKLTTVAPNAKITFDRDVPLPFPADLDDSGLRSIIGDVPHTPLEDAIAQDMARFKTLLDAGKIDLAQLEN